MPITKCSEEDDEVLAEQWMASRGYDQKPPSAQDPYQIRRIMRQCYANGVTMGRKDGLQRPHFTHAEIVAVVGDSGHDENKYRAPFRYDEVKFVLKALFPEATFDE